MSFLADEMGIIIQQLTKLVNDLEAMGLGKLSQEDHRALLRAVEGRDIERSVKLLEQHLNRGVEVITRYLDSPEAQSSKTSK